MQVGQAETPAPTETSPPATVPPTQEPTAEEVLAAEASPTPAPTAQAQPESESEGGDNGGLCPASLALATAAVAGGLGTRRRQGDIVR